jgi:hypothetical protein
MSNTEQKLAEALAMIERLQEEKRLEAIKTAKYPWQNPETVASQNRMSYNLKVEPELYLKIQWLMENKGGIKSIQKFFEKAGNMLADVYLEELDAK